MSSTVESNASSIKIAYFCKDCEKIIAPIRLARKYSYRCPVCKEKNISFGTEKSIKNYYRIAG